MQGQQNCTNKDTVYVPNYKIISHALHPRKNLNEITSTKSNKVFQQKVHALGQWHSVHLKLNSSLQCCNESSTEISADEELVSSDSSSILLLEILVIPTWVRWLNAPEFLALSSVGDSSVNAPSVVAQSVESSEPLSLEGIGLGPKIS